MGPAGEAQMGADRSMEVEKEAEEEDGNFRAVLADLGIP